MPAPSVNHEESDEGLLLRYREERQQADFAELVRRYELELYGYLRRFLGNAQLAEDVFQATFLQVHLKCDQFECGRAVRPWLYMIATNKAIDAKRRQSRLRLVSIDGVDRNQEGRVPRLADQLEAETARPDDEVMWSEHCDRVLTALRALPEHLRVVVELVYFQGLKYREAAQALSIPVGTVKSRMNAAMAKLIENRGESVFPGD